MCIQIEKTTKELKVIESFGTDSSDKDWKICKFFIDFGILSFKSIKIDPFLFAQADNQENISTRVNQYLLRFVCLPLERGIKQFFQWLAVYKQMLYGISILAFCYHFMNNDEKKKYYVKRYHELAEKRLSQIKNQSTTEECVLYETFSTDLIQCVESNTTIDCATIWGKKEQFDQLQQGYISGVIDKSNNLIGNIVKKVKTINEQKEIGCDSNGVGIKIKNGFYNVMMIKQCNYCHKKNAKLKTCKNCRNVLYCSKLCQKKDWNLSNHKSKCIKR